MQMPIPTSPHAAPIASPGPAKPFGARHARRTRPLVFLAEDDTDLRRLLGDWLREAGYDVLLASTGHDMLKLLTAASRDEIPVPDAFVMDVRMPRCSGIEVLCALRLADWQQPAIMITGFGDPSLHQKAADYGASVILDKPIDAEDLVDMLDLLLRLAHAEVMKPTRVADTAEDDREPVTLRCPQE